VHLVKKAPTFVQLLLEIKISANNW